VHSEGNPIPRRFIEPARLAHSLREDPATVEAALKAIRKEGLLSTVRGKPFLRLFEAEDRIAEEKARAGRMGGLARVRNLKSNGGPSPQTPRPGANTDTDTDTEAASSSTGSACALEDEGTGFPAFWAAYPRRVGKGAAEKAWAKARPPLAAVLAAVEACRATDQWRKDGGQFIPHPATWLNQRRWEDDRGPVTVAPRTGGRDLGEWARQQRAGGVPVADAPVTQADKAQAKEGAP
jgi:hypothetical protein